MEFTLVYDGPLPSGDSQGKVAAKHHIRKQFHPQLEQLWKTTPFLINMSQYHPTENNPKQLTYLDKLSNDFTRKCGSQEYRFAPLVCKQFALACSLDVLFLRRDSPGQTLIKSGGDIDNRLKTLFDAMTVPSDGSQLPATETEPQENPFFCLLQDDALITQIKVNTDLLLTPLKSGEHPNDVLLVINITLRKTLDDPRFGFTLI
jgi:Holliday junction resolvase RusA-like endonuclease